MSKKKIQMSIGQKVMRVLAYVWCTLMTLCILLPFYVILKSSFTSLEEIKSTLHFIWFPKLGATLEAYKTAIFSDVLAAYEINIFRSFFNTLWQGLPPVLIGLFVSGLAGFAYAKLDFPGKKKLFSIMLATMMIPGAVMAMPSYVYYDAIGWSHTALPLMIPGMFGGAMTVFFLRQFFMGIPTELVEAAKIDGMGFMRIYVSIMIPLAKPAFIAQFIFSFIGSYNNYMNPLLYLNGQPKLYSLQMALTLFRSIYAGDESVVAAFTVLALLPMLIIYIFLQKYFVEGVAATGVKG